MNLLFQLISSKYGTRSAVLELTRDQLAQQLVHCLHQADDEKQLEVSDDYILVLMEKPETDQQEEYTFSQAPILTVDDFLDLVYSPDQLKHEFDQLDKIADEKLQEQYV